MKREAGCPFCGKALKDTRTCGSARCTAKAAVWSAKKSR